MPFSDMAKDTIMVTKKNGEEFGPFKASVQKNKIFLFNKTVLVEPDDLIQRTMSNGGIERFSVVDPHFSEGGLGIPAHYQMDVIKLGTSDSRQAPSNVTYNVSITGNGNQNNVLQNSADNTISNNSGESITDLICQLRSIVSTEYANDSNLQDYLDVINEVESYVPQGKSKKSVIKTLLSSLPRVESVTSIVTNISSLF